MAEQSAGRSRTRLGATAVIPLLLVAMSFLQAPGTVTFDTDLDLSLNPSHLLHRALHLWSAQSGFGGVGDQTYGFLFPMGPFFLIGHLLQLPDWVVQRLWAGLVLVLAYEGARRLVRRLISPLPVVTIVAGLAWALSPRMLTVIGPFSAEALPVALLPWVVLPLVVHLPHDPRRAAWRSGLAVLCLGAVNATASLAVLPVPLLYLLTRTNGWRTTARSLAWWLSAVVLASLWWIGPLLLLGAYSPPFTDWVESARTTTYPVGAFAALRGATDWVAYVPSGAHGFWPAAWDLATSPGLVALTGLVGVLGLAGLSSRRLPERRFLLLTAILGFAVLTLGHAGSPASPFSGTARDLLDGALVPFRNIYKFDPVLRLPLVLGLAHLVHRVATRERARRWVPTGRRVGPLLVAGLLLAVAAPAWAGSLRPGPGFSALPSWWSSAADFVASDGVAGRTLVVPQATTGRYRWGRTIGEPLEALATSPWAVRDQVPLTQAGNTRVVDAVEAVLSSGRGSTALAAVLARSGVGQLIVRNDLDRRTADTLPPVRVRQALERSPGLRLLRSFGPPQPVPGSDTAIIDGAIDTAPAALEVWGVDPVVSGPHLAPLNDVVALSGGPEDLLALLEASVVGPVQPTVLSSDIDTDAGTGTGTWPGPRVITDGLQRRERSFGRVHDALGPVLTATESYRQVRPAHDLLPSSTVDQTVDQTVAAYDGLVSITASSSAAYPDSFGGTDLTHQPSAALDRDAATFWSTGSLTRPIGQWLQVTRSAASTDRTVTIRLISRPGFGPVVTSLRLDTEAGSVVRPVAATEDDQVLELPRGSWTRLRVGIAGIKGPSRIGVVGLREVTLSGAAPLRTLIAPSVLPPGSRQPAVVLRAPEQVEPCVVVAEVQRCDPGSAQPSEEARALDRTFSLSSEGSFALSGTVLPGQGLGLAQLLRPFGDVLTATASSSLDGGGGVGAAAAVDGDVRTSWVANPAEALPALSISWKTPQPISEIVLVHAQQPVVSAPVLVHVNSRQGQRDAYAGPDGTVRFAPLRTSSVILTFPEILVASSRSTRSTLTSPLPVGIAEVRLPQVAAQAGPSLSTASTGAFCGFGPVVTVDGTPYPTKVIGTVGDLRSSRPLQLEPCGPPLSLTAGTHRVRVEASAEFVVRSVVLRPPDAAAVAAPDRSLVARSWGQVHRSLQVGTGTDSLLVVPEAANRGWRATLDGRALRAMTVDGWQQGWVVPAGDGGRLSLDYTPDRLYRLALLGGGLAALLLLVLAALSVRSQVRELVLPVPRPPRRSAVAAGALAAVGLCFVAGGWVCATGAGAGLLLVALRQRRFVALAAWLLPLSAVVVLGQHRRGLVAAQAGTTPQVLCLLAVGALASLLVAERHD
jgi:arabinofuranan 3-O-arabinosyltransferase